MLSDFLALELYFEQPETIQFFEDLSKRYGTAPLKKALRAGYLMHCTIKCGKNSGKIALWLSEKGRQKALENAMWAD